MSNLLERLRSAANSNELRHEAADEIERLCAEVADLTGANVLLHGIVSNREEEISGLRAQLASASERVAEMQYEAGMYHSLYDVATERLASARKALEEIYTKDTRVTDGGKCHDLGPCAEIATAALFSLTDEQQQPNPELKTAQGEPK